MFDLSSIEIKKNDYDVLPAGKYTCFVTEAGLKDTKSGGQMITATLTIAGGQYDKRKIFTNFNVKNANARAVEIGMQQLKSLLLCAGANADQLGSPQELEGLRVGVQTKIRKSEEYGDKAEVSFFFKPTEGDAPKSGGVASDEIPF